MSDAFLKERAFYLLKCNFEESAPVFTKLDYTSDRRSKNNTQQNIFWCNTTILFTKH